MEIIIQGCKFTTNKSYVRIKYGDEVSFKESYKDDSLTLTVRRGFRWSDIRNDRIEIIKDQLIEETDYIKIENPVYDINGLKFTKLLPNDYIFSQYLVDNMDEFTMLYDETQCQILIPFKEDYNFRSYICLLNRNPYIKLLDVYNIVSLKNFYLINLTNKSIKLESNNEFRFNTKGFYQRYIIQGIDYQQSFIAQVKALLANSSIDCIRYPIDQNVKSVNHVVYRISDLNKQTSYKSGFYPMNDLVYQTTHFDFEITSPDLVLLNDFKHRYQNVDYISNLTVFQTVDKFDREWSANVMWGPISTDFNQDYDQDSQGNIAFKGNFTADINYPVVYDKYFYNIQEIILNLLSENLKLNKVTELVNI